MDQISSTLIQIIASGGGGALVAFGIFKTLGKKWIDNKFAQSLEAYRAIQAQELENAKAKLSVYSSQQLRLHEKEYEVFPEVWSRLVDAKITLERSIRSIRNIPNVNHMGAEEFEKFLEFSDLNENEREIMRGALSNKRNSEYLNIMEWRDIIDANKKFISFHEYLKKNRIFLDPEIKDKFDKIDDALWSTWVNKQLSHEDPQMFKRTEASREFREKVRPLMLEIESLVQKKIFPAAGY